MFDYSQQELFSRAYALAVISAAGYNYSRPEIDRDCIDFTVIGADTEAPSALPSLYVQIKSTALDRMGPDSFRYRIERRYYDALRKPYATAFILIVVAVPRDPSRWLSSTEKSLVLRRCGYWLSLKNYPEDQREKIDLTIPRSQRFTVASLRAIIGRLEQGLEL